MKALLARASSPLGGGRRAVLLSFGGLVVLGLIGGTAVGGVMAALGVGEEDHNVAAIAGQSAVAVRACPDGAGAIGYVARGSRVLVTAVGQDPEYVEINFPVSPNGYGWVRAGEVTADASLEDLPRRDCREILTESPVQTATPTAEPSPSPQPEPTSQPTSEPEVTPTPAPTLEPSPAADTEPPVIGAVSVSPTEVNEVPPDACVERPTTVEIVAEISDPSGLDKVAVEYAPPGASETVSVPMTLSGGVYRASLGPFATEGTDDATIELTVLARDGAGNAISKSAGTILVHDCTFL